MVVGSSPVAVTEISDMVPVLSEEFLDIQATIECEFTLKRVGDMIRTYSQCSTSNVLPKVFGYFQGAEKWKIALK